MIDNFDLYNKTRVFNASVIENGFSNLFSKHNFVRKNEISIIELGIGAGAFSFPMVKILKNPVIEFTGIDISDTAIEQFKRGIDTGEYRNLKWQLHKVDANYELPYKKHFDIALIAGVQHLLDNWALTLKRLIQYVKSDASIFIIFRIDPWIKLVFGDLKSNPNNRFANIIKDYFRLRYDLGVKLSNKKIKKLSFIYQPEKTIQILKKLDFFEVNRVEIFWKSNLSFQLLLDLIEKCGHSSFDDFDHKLKTKILDIIKRQYIMLGTANEEIINTFLIIEFKKRNRNK